MGHHTVELVKLAGGFPEFVTNLEISEKLQVTRLRFLAFCWLPIPPIATECSRGSVAFSFVVCVRSQTPIWPE